MRRFCLLVPVALLAACGESPRTAASRAGTSPGMDAPLAWQGLVACADCAGIDTRLRLERGAGDRARYQLVEAFLDEEGAEYFREEGRWERAGSVLTLRATGGGVRRYRIDRDGSLLAADRAGRDAGTGYALVPVPGPSQGL